VKAIEVFFVEDREAEYLHVLVFACPQCFKPLTLAQLNVIRSLEGIDADVFNLNCSCGWNGEMHGFQARHHWVGHWDR
jgi:hypothetical protein